MVWEAVLILLLDWKDGEKLEEAVMKGISFDLLMLINSLINSY